MYSDAQFVTNFDGDRVNIYVKINSVPSLVPLDPANTDYQRIMRLVEANELQIADPE